MELAWEWRGYCIGIKLARERQARRETRHGVEQTGDLPATRHPHDNAWRDHIMASGSRHVGPIR
ncbi:MAG: hypothetical protein WCD51_06785, partial [Anaerolineae bacterium]